MFNKIDAVKIPQNPVFNPPFLNRLSRNGHENCLAYALNHRLKGPYFKKLHLDKSLEKAEALSYFTSIINDHFKDPNLVKEATFNPGELPDLLDDYYIVTLLISNNSFNKVNSKGHYTRFDYHFLIQNQDGYFSHRRGEAQAERIDSDGNLILIPEKSSFYYIKDKTACFDYRFIGYLYVKLNSLRLEHMHEDYSSLQNTYTTPREYPDWKIKGNFSPDRYEDGTIKYEQYALNRDMKLVNKSSAPLIEEIEFLGYVKHTLTLKVKFKNLDFCNDFLDTLSPNVLSDIKTNEREVYFYLSSQKNFDSLLKSVNQLYPLGQKILSILPNTLNTRTPCRVTSEDWLLSYPIYNPNFNSSMSRFSTENCLSYALNIQSSSPQFSLSELSSCSTIKSKQLDYVIDVINEYYHDKTLVLKAPHKQGGLPEMKKGYYLASFHYSCEQKNIQIHKQTYYQQDDFHFLVQNNDGGFSHRRGQGYPPERVDANGHPIKSPESASFFYISPDRYETDYSTSSFIKKPVCMNYQFVGYIYIKTCENRLNLPNKSYAQLDDIERIEKNNPRVESSVKQFKNRFFTYPPLPEFFEDARNEIEKFHDSLKL